MLTFAFVLAALLYTTREAHGNGRFPRAQMIVTAPGGDRADAGLSRALWMRTTFGILVSTDGGRSFRWICEKAMGYTGQFDPPISVLKDGRLIVGTDDGVVSTTDGCTFTHEPGLEGEAIRDLTTDASGTFAYAISGARGKPGRVWKRAVSGKWTKLGKDYDDINLITIDVAPSNPRRIYMTGEPWSTVRGEVWLSNDDGATFIEQKQDDLKANGPFFLSYVDPKNPDRIILRHLHYGGSDLYVSTDGGKTVRQILHWKGSMVGFAKSEDGQQVWIADGSDATGIWRSTDRGEHYEPMAKEGVACLFARGKTLYACSSPSTLGEWALGISKDDGKTLEKVSGFAEVEGAMMCGDAGPSICEPSWPETRAAVLPTPDAGPQLPEAGVDAGRVSPAPPTRSNCGCEAVGSTPPPPWSIFCLGGLIPLAVWARARRRVDRI